MKNVKRFNTLKVILSFRNVILLISILFSFQILALPPEKIKEKPVELPAGTDPGWWQKAQQEIARSEYYVTQKDKTNITGHKSGYQAPNRVHNLRTHFTNDGIRVTPRNDKPEWEWGLSLIGYGLKGDVRPVKPAKIIPNKNRVEYQRGDNLTEWYVNDEKGLEQGFTIKAPFETKKSGSESMVILELGINGNLSGKAGSGDNVEFSKPGEASVINFGKLHAWDANGKVLPADMSIISYNLQIQVDTKGAVYPITIDPLATTPSWTAESDQAGALFGSSVSTAGDVNGDGYSDVIVGVQSYDGGDKNEGRAFIYHGSSEGLSNTPDWSAGGNFSYDYFGYSVATAGDVNGDGYSDVIVGVPYKSYEDYGTVYVFLGSSTGLRNESSWYLYANDSNSSGFGYSVATAGDVNGDGYSDIIVGEPVYNRVFAFYGSPTGFDYLLYSHTPSWTVEFDQQGSFFGSSVSSAGDVNGDGYSDVIVGAPYYDGDQTDEGRSFVYYGSSTGLSAESSWTAESNQISANFGSSVASAGDVNRDGYSDIIVSAPVYDNGETDEGRVYVYHGSSTGLSITASWTSEINQAYASYGFSVASSGDVNGDGYSDVIVGAPYYNNDQLVVGGVFLYYGSSTGLRITPSWIEESNQDQAYFGYSVATAGDMNGDGYSDIIVGAFGYDNDQTDEGRVFVYYNISESGLWGMGDDYHGQLGTGERIDRLTPVLISSDVSKVAAGNAYSLYIKTDDTLWGMGSNIVGELGLGNWPTVYYTPVKIASDVKQVAAGGAHSLYIKTDGTLWGMGHNGSGQLGDGGKMIQYYTPVQITSNVKQAAAGGVHSLFIKTNGTLWAMGQNEKGRLGDGTTITRLTPVQVASGVIQVAAGGAHSLFIKSDGTLWAMGHNDCGQLGDGTNIDRNMPVQIASGVSQVAAGYNNSLFIKTDGTLWAMGYNNCGHLGDGTNIDRNTPVQIASGVSQVAAGDHSLFIKTDGTLWGMGPNDSGKLGDGTTTSRFTPIQIANGVTRVATGENHSLFIGIITVDSDSDGLSDNKEELLGTDPNDADSDDDGITDRIETTRGTDPKKADSDNDGIQDGTESGITTGHVQTGEAFIPDASPTTTTNPLDSDSDDDGLSDGAEDKNHNGAVDTGETDPKNLDTDNDNMPDGWEVTNDLSPLLNDANIDADDDGFKNLMEYKRGTDPQDEASHPSKGMPWLPLLLEG